MVRQRHPSATDNPPWAEVRAQPVDGRGQGQPHDHQQTHRLRRCPAGALRNRGFFFVRACRDPDWHTPGFTLQSAGRERGQVSCHGSDDERLARQTLPSSPPWTKAFKRHAGWAIAQCWLRRTPCDCKAVWELPDVRLTAHASRGDARPPMGLGWATYSAKR